MKVTPRSEQLKVEHWVMMLYGQPSTWKTSTAFTTSKPLLLDFDKGAHRSEFRKDIVKIDSWQDVSDMTEKDLEPYDTIIIDTVGAMLDCLTASMIKQNPKMGNGEGSPSMMGWGTLKSRFAEWVKKVRMMNINMLFIAHEKEERNGDDVRIRPDIKGASFGEVFKLADQVGYMYKDAAGSTVLDFNPCAYFYGKNTGQFEKMLVPNFHTEPDFFQGLAERMLDKMNMLIEESKEFADKVVLMKNGIDQIMDAPALNVSLKNMKLLDDDQEKIMLRHLINQRSKELQLTYSKETKQFDA